VERKGFGAAAEHLHTAQPNLSTQDFPQLVVRKTEAGRIRLTETGIAFRQGILDARDEAITAIIAIERREIPSLRFGCTSF
jgi:hypothetical protein